MLTPDGRAFLRDLLLLLGLPSALLLGTLLYWRPWRLFQTPNPGDLPMPREQAARLAAVHSLPWRGMTITVPDSFVLSTTGDSRLDAIPDSLPPGGDAVWMPRMSILPLDSAAEARFTEAGAECAATGHHCWTDTFDLKTGSCHRLAAGMAGPPGSHIPLVECQVREAGLRFVAVGEEGEVHAFQDWFRAALHSAAP